MVDMSKGCAEVVTVPRDWIYFDRNTAIFYLIPLIKKRFLTKYWSYSKEQTLHKSNDIHTGQMDAWKYELCCMTRHILFEMKENLPYLIN
jgi:hypothetical protein